MNENENINIKQNNAALLLSLDCKKTSKCIKFIGKCKNKDMNWGKLNNNILTKIKSCDNKIKQYIEHYGNDCDKQVKQSLNILINIDNHNNQLELSEYDLNYDQHLLLNWRRFILTKYNDLKKKLNHLLNDSSIELPNAINRAKLLCDIDWFLLEHLNINNGFSHLYTEYQKEYVKVASSNEILQAIRDKDFDQVRLLMEELRNMKQLNENSSSSTSSSLILNSNKLQKVEKNYQNAQK